MITQQDIQTLERIYSPVGKVLLQHLKDHGIPSAKNTLEVEILRLKIRKWEIELATMISLNSKLNDEIIDLTARNKNLAIQLVNNSGSILELKRQVADLISRKDSLCFQLVSANTRNSNLKEKIQCLTQ